MLYRFTNNICYPLVDQWDSLNASTFDQAGRGSSALFAATQRCIIAEIAVAIGSLVACALHDYDKFFDSIEVIDLLNEVVATDYPVAPFLLAIDQHLAPRVIQCQGVCGKPMSVFRSIVAGCKTK